MFNDLSWSRILMISQGKPTCIATHPSTASVSESTFCTFIVSICPMITFNFVTYILHTGLLNIKMDRMCEYTMFNDQSRISVTLRLAQAHWHNASESVRALGKACWTCVSYVQWSIADIRNTETGAGTLALAGRKRLRPPPLGRQTGKGLLIKCEYMFNVQSRIQYP